MNSIQIKTAQRQAFMEIFEMVATNKRINKVALKKIFDIINYKISTDQFEQICGRAFGNKQWITYQQFMQLFIMKTNDYNLVDVKNALRVLAGDDDVYIPMQKIKKMLASEGQSQQKIREMIKLLGSFIDMNQRFNYRQFLKSLS